MSHIEKLYFKESQSPKVWSHEYSCFSRHESHTCLVIDQSVITNLALDVALSIKYCNTMLSICVTRCRKHCIFAITNMILWNVCYEGPFCTASKKLNFHDFLVKRKKQFRLSTAEHKVIIVSRSLLF